MSSNQKQQPVTGASHTQRYSGSPYQPILPQPTNRSDAFHNPATYVTPTQGPNQGPGLRSVQSSGPPNQSSTPPNAELKVPSLQGPITQMQFVQNQQVRPAPPFFPPRGTGGPPTQTPRMPNQQHRAQGPPPLYQSPYGPPVVFVQQPTSVYYGNPRPPNNMIGPQTYPHQVFSQPLAYQTYPSPTSSGVTAYTPVFPMFPSQSAPMAISRTSGTPVSATPSNTTSGSLQNAAILSQPGPASSTYSKTRQRRPNAVSIIDPNTGEDKLNEIFDEANTSHPASGESSARHTPQPTMQSKEVQAIFAKQVAQAISEGKEDNTSVEQHHPIHGIESVSVIPPESFQPAPPSVQPIVPQRYDVQNSSLQYDAKEFVCAASKPVKESTPIVSANSDAVEVILSKKDRESPVKGKKQNQREKHETPKEAQIKGPESERSSSIVNEENVSSVSSPLPNSHISSPEVDSLVNKETIKEHTDKKPVQNISLEHKPSESESNIKQAAIEVIMPSNGKSKGSRNKNAHHQNGKPQQVPQQQSQQSLPVPVPQPPKPNNRSNKSKVLNIKGANKEGTDMDAFNDNSSKAEINANVLPPNENDRVAIEIPSERNDVSNANGSQCPTEAATVPAPSTQENNKVVSETRKKDANENITTIKSENLNANTNTVQVAPTINTKPVKVFDVTSIIKDTAHKPRVSPFSMSDNRDETDRAIHNDKNILVKSDVNNKVSTENAINYFKSSLPYKPDQWAPDRPDGRKIYERDFLLALKYHPASQQKPENIPDSVLQDDRNRQIDGRLVMGGRTDFINPPFSNYGGKSGSQRGTLTKRNSQSGKMGSRGGDKNVNKPQPKVSISLRGDVKLHEVENAWKPTRFQKGENVSEEEKKTEALYKKVRSVLNKLTPQKFETLVNQVRQLQIDTRERLQGVIDLVFEKAIDEPNFSVAYAMMCKEIQNMQVCIGDDKKSLALRTLLVSRCQTEFEKQSVDETARNTKVKEIEECSDPERKKELVFELEEYDRRLRMKSVGTIRFIGELFKQQMLTASIMRRCLQTLLDNKDEESLECLCKLLTTVGKELESKNVDLSTIFDEMKRITEGKRQKVSSRIRFMLQDVIELRDSKWIPRRGDLNPKTIDQIQKEAENEHMTIQAMNVNPPRKEISGGSRNAGPRQKMSEDGWSSVSSRNNRQQPFSIQTDKIRAPKLPLDEPFGSSQLFGTWGKGAGGVKNQQPLSTTSTNMYAPLENIDTERRPMGPRSNKDPYMSKGPSLERNSYKYDGRGSRSGSQHRDTATPIRSTGPPPSVAPVMPPSSTQLKPQTYPASIQSTAVSSTQNVPKLSEEQIERRIRNSLEEYINGCGTSSEYFQDISSTVPPSDFPKVIYESYNYNLEKSQSARLKTGELFAKLIKSGNITVDDFAQGFEDLIGNWEDLVIDIPQIWQYFAEDIVCLFLEEVLPFSRLRKLLDSLIKTNVAKKLLQPLFSLIVKEKGPNFLQQSWRKSELQLSDFMPSEEVQTFIQESNLEFLLGGESPVGQSQLSYDDIQKKLSEFLRNRAPFDDIVNWISANVGNRVNENKFIRALATAIFENSISKNKFQSEVLTSYSKLIQKYVDNNMDYELQCLYALQSLVHKLEHPQGVLLQLCDKLYEDSTFCQESFIAWENSSDPAEQEGKGVALKQLTSFFTQLKENEEEDDFSSQSEDA